LRQYLPEVITQTRYHRRLSHDTLLKGQERKGNRPHRGTLPGLIISHLL